MCWLLIFLASAVALQPELWKKQVERLGEIVTGPAQSKSLILHFDLGVPADIQQDVMQEVHHVPHLFTHGHNYTYWLSPYNYLHVALLTNKHQVPVFYPPPSSLLILALESHVDPSVLRKMEKSVKSLAFISAYGAVYTILPFISLRPVILGHWHPGHFTHWNSLFKNRFRHFHQHIFHIAGWNADRPFLYTNDNNECIHAGVAVEILNSLSVPLNFTYTLTKEPPDLEWGNFVNGTWTGLLGMVNRGDKNFTVNSLYPSPERHRGFAMSPPCWADGYAAYLLRPQPHPAWSNIHRPFSYPVWSSLVSIMFAAHLFLYMDVSTATI